MWGIAWGVKIKTTILEGVEFQKNTDIIQYLYGNGERIRTSDLRVMRPMHAFVMVCYLLL